METFAADHLTSVQDLDDRNASRGPPSPTTDDKADKGSDLNAAQDTQSGITDELISRNSSLRARLDRLLGFRIQTDVITFTSSEPHGCGAKAEVVKATLKGGDGSDDQQVAVKKLRYHDDINERKFGNEFVHEVDVMARLSHNNIIRLIRFVENLEEGRASIVLSWEPNGNVSEFLATGKWEIPERISLIKDTFAGIEYLRTQKPPICHGDLKSLNILVSATYRAIIIDFGSARILKETEDRQADRDEVLHVTRTLDTAPATDERIEHTKITIVASSNQLTLTGPAWPLRWAAPEVALGELQSLASDVWAAGWICWEVMTDKVPFPELNSEGAIVLKVVEGQVPVAREDTQLSQIISLCSLMTDCWAFDPWNRPNIALCNRTVQWMPSVPPSGTKTSGFNGPSAELLCEMGRIHSNQGSFKEASALFQQALSVATSAGDQRTSADALIELGGIYQTTSKFAKAEQNFTWAQDIYTQIGDQFGQARALHLIGRTYFHQSKLTEAEESYTRARTIYSHIGDVNGQALTLRALGNFCSERSQYLEAEEFYNQAIDIYDRTGNDLGHADTLMRLGELFSAQSEYAKAEELFNRALDKYSRIGSTLGTTNMKRALAGVYRMQGLNTKAASLYAEARNLYALIGDSEMEEDCSRWLDVVLSKIYRPRRCLSLPSRLQPANNGELLLFVSSFSEVPFISSGPSSTYHFISYYL